MHPELKNGVIFYDEITKFVLVGSLMTFMSLSEVGASDCSLSVKISGSFNPALVSEISSSLISQDLREVKPIPSSGISGDTECANDVSSVTWESIEVN